VRDLGLLYIRYGPSKEARRLAKTLVRMYTRPLQCMPDPVGYLIKPSGQTFICAEIISQIYPGITRTIYLYRDMEKVTESLFKMSFIIRFIPTIRLGYVCCRLNGRLVSHFFKQAAFPTEGTNRTLNSDYCIGVFMAAIAGNV
jgi:hypothetical protein